MRKQILSLAIAGLLTIFLPGAVYPLGLGKIEVKSRLNQPLRAEIILRGVHQIPLEDIKVALASSEAFSQAGLNRALVLSALHFHTLRKKTGETVVKVTSQNPIREPFLRFLVTMTWPQGQLLREYVVLLDPPFLPQKQESFFIKTTAVDGQSGSELTGLDRPNGIAQTRRPVTEGITAFPIAERAISTYGPTAPTDTLWRIAQRLQSSRPSITLQQMMLALQKVNPDAFFDNNINALKSKVVLKIPIKEGVLKHISPAEATHQVRQQNQAWAALVGKRVDLERQTEEDGSKRSNVLRAEPQGETDILVAQGQNLLSSGAVPRATESSNDTIAPLKIQLSRVRETLATQMEESEKTQTRLREIALQIKTLRQRLSARDSLLTGLWGLSKEQREALDLVNALAALSVKNPQESISPSPIATEFSSSLLETTEKELDGGATVPSAAMSLRNLALFCGSGALFLALVIWRRRKHKIAERLALVEAEQKRNRRELAGIIGKQAADLEVVKISGEQPTSLVAVQMAEDSLAANRYHEAATILKAILKKNPERQDLRLRLAKVYYALNNGSEFIALVEEWAPNQNENNAVWAELVAMGKILSPNHPWFVSSQRNDEETYQEPELVSSDRSSPLDPPLFIFGEETAEVFSPTGELALKVEISGAEDEALNIDRERMDWVEQDVQTDEQRGEGDGLGDFSSEEAPRKSLELSSLELDSTQKGNALMWAPETGANDLEEVTLTVTHLAKRDAVGESSTEKIGVSRPGEALMNDLDEVEIELNRNDTEGACDLLGEVITAGNEKQ